MASGHGEPYTFKTIDELLWAYDKAKKGRERLQEALEQIASEICVRGQEASLSWIRHLAKEAIERDAED